MKSKYSQIGPYVYWPEAEWVVRLQILLGNVVISQGGVVLHIAPVSSLFDVILFSHLIFFFYLGTAANEIWEV